MGTVKKIKINEGVENQLEDGVIVCVFAVLQRFWNNWVSMNETFECFFLRSQDTNYTEKIFFFCLQDPKVTCEESEETQLSPFFN